MNGGRKGRVTAPSHTQLPFRDVKLIHANTKYKIMLDKQ